MHCRSKYVNMYIRYETREKARQSLARSIVSKSHTHIPYMLRQCTSIAYQTSANRTTRTVFYWASTFPCNTYPISHWQRRLYLLCRDAHFRSSKWCITIYNDAAHVYKWTTTLPGILRNFGRIDLPKSTPNSCAIYNTTNKQKTRTPVQSICRCRCRP